MDAVFLSRLQFAFTVCFHFLFPAMTLGTTFIILVTETLHVLNRGEVYKKITDFLVRLLALIFVVGAATGIVMEFSFGTNWATYSRTVADVFGPILAIEGLVAFFLESVFLGVLLFGRNRVSKGVYWLSAFLVFLGGHLSGFWIVVANSWMQTPAGYTLTAEGKIILADFYEAVFNPSTNVRFLHTVMASWMTSAILLAGIAGYYVRRGIQGEAAKKMLGMGVFLIAATSLLQLGTGHHHAIEVIDRQPVKAAAFEGHFETSRGAPLYVFGYADEQNEKTYGLYIPKAFSFLYNFDLNSELKGLKDFPREHWPPVNFVFQTYHLMVAIGGLCIGVGLFGLYLMYRGKLHTTSWFLALLPFLIPLPHIAHETGWITAEVGRQPWIIEGLMKTSNAASVVVSSGQILFSLSLFLLVYALLSVVFLMIFLKIVKKGPEAES